MKWVAVVAAAALLQGVIREMFEWLPRLADVLLRLAARFLPAAERDMRLAEWRGEIDTLPEQGISKLVFALVVLVNAPRVRRALERPPDSALLDYLELRTLDAGLLHGFRVEDVSGRLVGKVDQIWKPSPTGPDVLSVRSGWLGRRRRLVSVESISSVDDGAKVIGLRVDREAVKLFL